jgi:hypothetical protein
MGAAATPLSAVNGVESPKKMTLLELVSAIGRMTEDDREVVAVVLEMLSSGQVRLTGSFRNVPVDRLR